MNIDKLFAPIVDANLNSFKDAMIIIITALVLGFITSLVYIFTNKKTGYSSSLALSLVFLPPIMAVIMYNPMLLINARKITKKATNNKIKPSKRNVLAVFCV